MSSRDRIGWADLILVGAAIAAILFFSCGRVHAASVTFPLSSA